MGLLFVKKDSSAFKVDTLIKVASIADEDCFMLTDDWFSQWNYEVKASLVLE